MYIQLLFGLTCDVVTIICCVVGWKEVHNTSNSYKLSGQGCSPSNTYLSTTADQIVNTLNTLPSNERATV